MSNAASRRVRAFAGFMPFLLLLVDFRAAGFSRDWPELTSRTPSDRHAPTPDTACVKEPRWH